MILVPTVKHTGSHFVSDHLLAEYDQAPLKGPIPKGQVVVMDHVYTHKLPLFRKLINRYDPVIIIPIRHPKVCAMSWCERGWELTPDFFLMWENIMTFKGDKVFYLPLDVDDREEWLKKINDGTDLVLSTDWPEVGSNSKLRYKDLAYKDLIGWTEKTVMDPADRGEIQQRISRTGDNNVIYAEAVKELVEDSKLKPFLAKFYKKSKD